MVDFPINLKTKDGFEPLELELWFEGGFKRQIRDIYPEVLRLKGCGDENAILSQWDNVIDLVSMTMLDPDVEQNAKDELIQNVGKLRDFYAGNVADEETAFSWWNQWKEHFR